MVTPFNYQLYYERYRHALQECWEISTDNSSPRELVVVDNKVYFTNWNTKDVKVLNLFNYKGISNI